MHKTDENGFTTRAYIEGVGRHRQGGNSEEDSSSSEGEVSWFEFCEHMDVSYRGIDYPQEHTQEEYIGFNYTDDEAEEVKEHNADVMPFNKVFKARIVGRVRDAMASREQDALPVLTASDFVQGIVVPADEEEEKRGLQSMVLQQTESDLDPFSVLLPINS